MQLSLFDLEFSRTQTPEAQGDPECLAPIGAAAITADCDCQEVQPIHTLSGPTMEDVLAALSDAGSDLKRAACIRSAVRKACVVFGRLPAEVPADPGKLQALIAGARPQLAGVKPHYWRQVKSQLRTALTYFGQEVMPLRDAIPLHPDWQALMDRAADVRYARGLSRLLRDFSRRGVTPATVRQQDFEVYRDRLQCESLHSDPERAFRAAVRLWNMAASTAPDWPDLFVPVASRSRQYSLEWGQFHPDFLSDLEDFLSTKEKPRYFSKDYAPPVREVTTQGRRAALRRIASWLVLSGFPVDQLTSFRVLTDPKNVEAAFGWQLTRQGRVGQGMDGYLRLLITVTRHWLKDQGRADELRDFLPSVHVDRQGITEKNWDLLSQFDDPEHTHALVTLPMRIYRAARKRNEVSALQATRLMYALAVQILLVTPIRLKNLHQLRLGTDIREVRRGRRIVRSLVLTSDKTKTSRAYEAPWPKEIEWMLQAWLTRYRPIIWSKPTDLLFPSPRGGGTRSPGPFSTHCKQLVQRELGLTMNPHLYRHLAGKLFLDHDENGIVAVSQILGHTNTRTTLRNYARLDTGRALKRYHDGVLAPHLRDDWRPQVRARD